MVVRTACSAPDCGEPEAASWVINGVKRIAIFGTEATGKTQLAQRLAEHFGEPWAPAFVRQFAESREAKIAVNDLDEIARGQMANEDAAAARANRVVFCDTELITCTLWNGFLFPNAAPGWVLDEADRRASKYALYLLCDADVPFAQDPQRCFPDAESRENAGKAWRDALVSRGLPFVEIRGEWADRERAAIEAVERVLSSG
jgi:HTH-type transcriptional regulator, transcriptional repressor of NAD biosynthesis genes